MADAKISALPASTTPLAGTEVLPIVQSGVTKKTSVESVLTSVQPSGTANSVAFLNGSKVLTSGSTLTFDGTSLGIGKLAIRNDAPFITGANLSSGANSIAIGNTGAANLVLATNSAERMRIVSGGNVGIGVTSPTVKLDVSGEIRASTGILFGADTAAANTLDDYEEGTFTPTVIGSVTAGTGTYSANNGFYTKVGDRVTFTILINMSDHTGSGNMRLAGLPFTSSAVTNDISYVVAAGSNLTFTGQLTAQVSGNSTEIALLGMVTAMSLAAVILDTSCDLRLTGVYRSA